MAASEKGDGAEELLQEMHEMLAEMHATLRGALEHFDPPAPGPRERHLRLVERDG